MTTTSETGTDQPVITAVTDPDAAADTSPDMAGAAVLELDAARRRTATPDTEPDALADTQPATTPTASTDTDLDEDADTSGRVVLVDSPNLPDTNWLDRVTAGKRRPILPTWARSAEQFHHTSRMVVAHYAHALAFHAVRTPFYAATVAFWSPRGAFRMLAGIGRWVRDLEGQPVRDAAARKEDAEQYLRLSRQRDSRVRARAVMTALGSVATAAGGLFLLLAAPPVAMLGMTLATVAAFGWRGAPADKPVLGPAVLAPKHTKLTSDIVLRALGALGLAEINKAMSKGGHGISFTAPITHDGPGWRAELDLPYGVTVSDIMERRDRLASGLRRPLGCVWPEPVHDEHTGRLVLWVGREDMSKAKPAPWPFARAERFDLFKPLPFGTDPRGRLVPVTLPETNVLIGSLPGGGKTSAVRVFMLAAALDPTAELWAFEFKGSGDLASARKVATRYASGIDDESIEQGLTALEDLEAELLRRSKAITKLPLALCPDNKVTRQIADRRSLGLHPLVVIIDECQNLFAHPRFGKRAGELAEKVIKLGRALGIILILATQRPDAASLPTGVSGNVGVRFCLRVTGQTENDMILGTSMYKNGVRATTLRPTDKGIGYLVGAADEPQVTRSFYLDKVAAEKIAERARAMREAAGTLTGYAAGQDTERPAGHARDLLADLNAIWPAEADKAWNETLAAGLAELRPDVYTGWTGEQVTAALKPHGITPTQVWGTDPTTGKGANRRGITRDQVTTAITQRDESRKRRRRSPTARSSGHLR